MIFVSLNLFKRECVNERVSVEHHYIILMEEKVG